jgi:hypothetical protein
MEFCAMADEKITPGTVNWVDRDRINVNEEHALSHWSEKLGVTSWEVKAAVRKVGPAAKDVARALGHNTRN